MLRTCLGTAMRAVLLAVIVAGTSLMVSGQTGVKNGEWPHWGADLGNTKYSALDHITRDNVKNLRVVWRWKADNFGPRPQNNLEATPLMVGGALYTTAGTRPSVAAIDGATGETLWTYRFDEGRRGDMAPRSVARGVEYWTDGKVQRIILIQRISSRLRNSDVEQLPRWALASAAAHGASDRRGCRSSSRPTDASPPTT